MLSNEVIKKLALENGFKLKEQGCGQFDLNSYVCAFAHALEQAVLENQPVNEVSPIVEPTYFDTHNMYSEADACVEFCHIDEYTYEQAIAFVEALGHTVRDGGYCGYDDMFKDWRGYVNVKV